MGQKGILIALTKFYLIKIACPRYFGPIVSIHYIIKEKKKKQNTLILFSYNILKMVLKDLLFH